MIIKQLLKTPSMILDMMLMRNIKNIHGIPWKFKVETYPITQLMKQLIIVLEMLYKPILGNYINMRTQFYKKRDIWEYLVTMKTGTQ